MTTNVIFNNSNKPKYGPSRQWLPLVEKTDQSVICMTAKGKTKV